MAAYRDRVGVSVRGGALSSQQLRARESVIAAGHAQQLPNQLH